MTVARDKIIDYHTQPLVQRPEAIADSGLNVNRHTSWL